MSARPSGPPAVIYIIRHGEKPGAPDDGGGGPDLSVRGSARAAALPSLFAPSNGERGCRLSAVSPHDKREYGAKYVKTGLSEPGSRFMTPEFLFATKESSKSNRPFETITPLSATLELKPDNKYRDADYSDLAQKITSDGAFASKVILVCWHHGTIPALAKALGVQPPPSSWPADVFDRVWVITYLGSVAQLKDQPQCLLYGDSDQ
jgi:hypothetical protein